MKKSHFKTGVDPAPETLCKNNLDNELIPSNANQTPFSQNVIIIFTTHLI